MTQLANLIPGLGGMVGYWGKVAPNCSAIAPLSQSPSPLPWRAKTCSLSYAALVPVSYSRCPQHYYPLVHSLTRCPQQLLSALVHPPTHWHPPVAAPPMLEKMTSAISTYVGCRFNTWHSLWTQQQNIHSWTLFLSSFMWWVGG